MDTQARSQQVIESLRKGIPPQRGVDLYSVGHEKLIEGIKKHHLSGIADRGIIRFVSGSWGAGKTHFFRIMREVAFKGECLVSNVELSVNDAPLNKFERVFYAILRNVNSPYCYAQEPTLEAAPFGSVLRESLAFLGTGNRAVGNEVPYEAYNAAKDKLMGNRGIDIDFKKIVQKYWETFLPESPDPAIQEQTREEILQWFGGEGSIGAYRKRFGVNKMITKDTAKVMLQSLAAFVRLAGYQGLVILFDEAEQSYSIMRKSALKDAWNNLLSLINNIEALSGLFLVYATTPEFYTDPKYGIVQYGALSGRIGKPEEKPPTALSVVWNMDAVQTDLSAYQSAAVKIKGIYASANPDARDSLPGDEEVRASVEELHGIHPSLSAVQFWRVLVTSMVRDFDNRLDGEVRPMKEVYRDVMDRLREE
jgi:hypothetical protein